MLMRDRSHRFNIEHIEPRVAQGFCKQNLGVGANIAAPCMHVARINEGGFNTEALHCVELLCNEVCKRVRLVDALVQLQLFCLRQGVVLESLKLLAKPVASLNIHNVHELDSDVLRVGIFVGLNQIFKFPVVRLFGDCALERDLEPE